MFTESNRNKVEQNHSRTISTMNLQGVQQKMPGTIFGIPGVGPKTAACVLMFNLNSPVLPVDTHVHRVSRRLGLIGTKSECGSGSHSL